MNLDLYGANMTKQRENFNQNIQRVEALCKIYTLLQNDHKSQSEYKNTDVLRSAVVLLHASFEDYFRTILIQWLPLKGNSFASAIWEKSRKVLFRRLNRI